MSADLDRIAIPFEERRLANGLRVIVSPEDSAPVVTVALYYNVGFRLEPRGRTGFAHLFGHLKFQGSEQMAKLESEIAAIEKKHENALELMQVRRDLQTQMIPAQTRSGFPIVMGPGVNAGPD